MKYAKHIIARVALVVTFIASLLVLPIGTAMALPLPMAKEPAVAHIKKKSWACKDVLARRLHAAGFRGENLREAWAIAMRESGGNPKSISASGDYGVFQFNHAAHGGQTWWSSRKLLTPEYNIQIAYRMSKGGKWWGPWDLTGQGEFLGRYTPRSTYNAYRKWYERYPCAVGARG